MEVMLGCPIRDREWIVEKYLECVINLEFDKKNIHLMFIVNDSTDKTYDILCNFKEKMLNEYGSIDIHTLNLKQVKDCRRTVVRQQIYSSLAKLRNTLLVEAKRYKVDYLFSVDSDILFAPNTLNSLIACNKDIISAQIWNDSDNIFPNVLNYNFSNTLRHYKDFPRDAIFECDVTGAIYLIKNTVINSDVKYAWDMQGEDVAFCNEAQRKGFSIWCNPLIKCKHIMERGMLNDPTMGSY